MNTASANAAIPDRKLAICHEVMDIALMAAPPVENRKAAAISKSQLVGRACDTEHSRVAGQASNSVC